MKISEKQLLELGFEKDCMSDDRFIYRSQPYIELSGSSSIGNHTPLQHGQYMLTADCGFIHLSRVFNDIGEIDALIKAIS